MNVLIVDDEPIIRVGLRTLIDWQAYGLTLVGEASDGEEALGLVREGSIDILVTDIRMPKMDGLELIRQSRETKPDLGVLVLSCLDDFVFVKEAMKLGASDYILKPTMEPDGFVEILLAIKQQVNAIREQSNLMREWRSQFEQTKQYRLSTWLRRYLQEGIAENGLEEQLFGGGSTLYTALVKWSDGLRVSVELLDGGDCAASIRMQGNSALLLLPMERSLSQYEQHAGRFGKTKRIEARIAEAGGVSGGDWVICVSQPIAKLSDLTQAVQLHDRQLHHRFYVSEDRLIWDTDPLVSAPAGDVPLPYEQRNDLFKAIASHNPEAMYYNVMQIAARIRADRPGLARLHAFVFELLALAVGYARENGYANMDDYEQRFLSTDKIAGCFHVDELSRWLTEAMQELWSCRFGTGSDSASTNPFIRKALQFMKDNYRRNIGTVDIAEHVKLSRSYLSDLYSKEMGESLTETLTRIRIEEAKKKLRSGELKVYEIAEKVGFSDPKSFAKTFKRIVGCTPKEYDMQNK